MKKIVRMTESDLTRLVRKVIAEEKGSEPIRIDVSDYSEWEHWTSGTKWYRNERWFYNVVDMYGPIEIYRIPNTRIRIACIGNQCAERNDMVISREEAAEILGVSSLDDINK